MAACAGVFLPTALAGASTTRAHGPRSTTARILGLESDVFDAAVTEDERDHCLRVFAVMFSRSAFERPAKEAPSFHDRARSEAAYYEERVAKNLSDLVFEKLYPSLGKAIADKSPPDTDLDEIRNGTLILLYRLPATWDMSMMGARCCNHSHGTKTAACT